MGNKTLLYRVVAFVILAVIAMNYVAYSSYAAGETDSKEETENANAGDIAGIIASNSKIVGKLLSEYKFTNPNGHGFAAEQINSFIDNIHLKKSVVVGDNNVKNGPDRLLFDKKGNKIFIQDKYYKSASESVNACFDRETGVFRYYDSKNKPMQIEVPKDQYDDAIRAMEEKIKAGKVKGVKNPQKAKDIIRKGKVTYKQAVNIAKPMTVDSIKYDAKSGVITATCAVGISTVFNVAISCIQGESFDKALEDSALEGLKTGGEVFCISVISSQLSKTGLTKALKPSMDVVVKKLGPKVANSLANAFGRGAVEMTEEQAMNAASKILSSQIVVASVTFVVLSAGDIKDFFQGKISTKQLIKNLIVTGSGIAGGAAGAIGGAALGSVIPGAGNAAGAIIGFVGGVAGGAGASFGAEKLLENIYEDDAKEMYDIISQEFQELGNDYMISDNEANKITDKLQKKLEGDVLKDMYQSDDRKAFAKKLMTPLFDDQVKQRPHIKTPTTEEIRKGLLNSLDGMVFIH